MADGARTLARRRARRRRIAVIAALAVVATGAGTAYAMTGSGGVTYRLATVQRADVRQTVDADGTLAAHNTATLSFAAAGAVAAVGVGVGDHVSAGATVASLDATSLNAAVTAAENTLAQAKQKLADDEQAEADGTAATDSVTGVRLTSAITPISSTPTPRSGGGSLAQAQQAVVRAQQALDAAIARVTADVQALNTSCAVGDQVITSDRTVTADSTGVATGTVDSIPVVVALLGTTTSTDPQPVAAGGTFRFEGLTGGAEYHIALVPSLDTAACTTALATIDRDQSARSNPGSVTSTAAALATAIRALNAAAGTSSTGGSGGTGSGSTGSSGRSTGAAGSGSSSGASGSSGSTGTNRTGGASSTGAANSTGGVVTAEQIAADTEAVDAAGAEVTLARHDVRFATLTSPIAGTVAAVAIAKGDAVAANSTSATITVVGPGALSVDVSIGIAKIDLVKVGQPADVTVDGRSRPIRGVVTLVGAANTSGSTGTSSAYTVTVRLDAVDTTLYDGMGAAVAIDVGTAHNALTVPISALHSLGALHTVTVYSGGKATTTRVTLGVIGTDRVQVTSGVRAGQKVVLADVSAAVPSSSTTNTRGRTGFGGLGGGFGGAGLGGVRPAGGFGQRNGN